MDTHEELERSALQGFLHELRGLLPTARAAVQHAARRPDEAALAEARRRVHTLAASAALLSLPTLSEAATLLEQAMALAGSADAARREAAARLIDELLQALELAADGDIDLQTGAAEQAAALLQAGRARLTELTEADSTEPSPPPLSQVEENTPQTEAEPGALDEVWNLSLEPDVVGSEIAPDVDVAALLSALPQPSRTQSPLPEASVSPTSRADPVEHAPVAPAPADQESQPPATSDPDVLAIFGDEARTLLAEARALYDRLSWSPDDATLQYELERTLHTLKGAAAMLGIEPLRRAARAAEERAAALPSVAADSRARAFSDLRAAIDALEQHIALLPSAAADEASADASAPAPPATTAQETPATTTAESPPALSKESELETEISPAGTAATRDISAAPDPDLIEVFLSEAREHLAAMTLNVMALEQDPTDRERLAELRRAAHTLKGAAAATGFSSIAAYCHSIEDALDAAFERGGTCDVHLIPALSRGLATLEELLQKVSSGDPAAEVPAVAPFTYEPAREPSSLPVTPPGTGEETPLGESLPAVLPASAQAAPAPAIARATPAARPLRRPRSGAVRVPVHRLETALTHAGELTVATTAQSQRLAHMIRLLVELRLTAERLSRLGRQFERQFEAYELVLQDLLAGKAPAHAPWQRSAAVAGSAADFDLLELDRYTELHRFGRALVEMGADVAALHRELAMAARELGSLTAQQHRRAQELQDDLLSTRLASLDVLFGRLYRSTRALAERLGKRIELDFSGQDIELDRAVQEAIGEALLHVLRNAVDHGVEPAAVRAAAGKPETGVIRCRAMRDGRTVAITVEDDGAGIDPEAVYRAAIERGLLTPGVPLSREEKLDLIFLQGLSTRRDVTDISGRGVGMDVVRETVMRLQGEVELWSEPGRGTRVTLRVPISIALARVLLVRASGELFAVPVGAGARVVRVTPQIQTTIGGALALILEDRLVPLRLLGELLGLPPPEQPAQRRAARAIISTGPRGPVALMVDDVLGQHDVLVRPLPRCMRRLPGASGVTVLADGTVVLILNLTALTEPALRLRAAPGIAATQPARRRMVLVVDDSLSIRRIVCAAFERAGWDAVPARDGEEALALLQRLRPDILFVDLEMPRLDGFELTARLRRQPAWRHLPIVVLTSRAGEKHRQRAAELGADAYLTKPCPDRELLSTAEALVAARRTSAGAET
jgi:chemosensory pili system protein ChpA (sensor histidine kinase/response regulator)